MSVGSYNRRFTAKPMIAQFFSQKLTWLAVLVSLGIGAMSAHTMWTAREEQWAYHERTNANLSATLAKGLEWSLDGVDLTLQKIAIVLQDAHSLETSEYLSHTVLLDAVWRDIHFSGVTVLDADGREVLREEGVSRPGRDLSQEDFFQAFRAGPRHDVFIGQPSQSLKGKDLVLPVARPVRNAQGEWQGVVVGHLHMLEINAWLHSMNLGELSGVNVIREDGLVLTRFPYDGSSASKTLAGSRNLQRFLSSPQGSFVGQAVLDGIERLYSYHRVGPYPIVINTAQATQSIVQGWKSSALQLGGFALVLIGGCIALAVLFSRELVRREATETDLFAEKERMRLTLRSIGDAVVCTDANGLISYVNPVAQEFTGLSSAEVKGQPLSVLQVDWGHGTQSPASALGGDAPERKRTMMVHRASGERIEVEVISSPVLTASGNVLGAVAVLRDVTLAAEQEARMQRLAFHDALTGLPNRLLLQDRAQQALAQAQRQGSELAVLYLDLDNFKPINDFMGHEAGDAALVQIAQTLRSCVRASDTVCRLGGDEFVVLFNGSPGPKELQMIAEKILHACSQTFEWGAQRSPISISGGISIYPDHAHAWSELLRCADQALYCAKKAGRSQISLYIADGEARRLTAPLPLPLSGGAPRLQR